MRVSITHHTVRRGFFLKTTYHEVHLKVAFTHEEGLLDALAQMKLWLDDNADVADHRQLGKAGGSISSHPHDAV